MYNMTFLNSSIDVYGLAAGVNNEAGGWLIGMILLIFWILLFMVFNKFDSATNFIAVNFIISLLGGMLLTANLIHWGFLILPVILLFIGIFVKVFGE